MYYTYVLRMSDHSLYTGITTDLARRIREHASGGKKSAKYTRARTFLVLECAWECPSRAEASRLEWAIKHLKKETKERLCASPLLLNDILPALPADAFRALDKATLACQETCALP